MSCVLCKHGETRPGLVTVTLQRGETTVVLKRVPADVCDNCGGYYLSSEGCRAGHGPSRGRGKQRSRSRKL